MTQFHQACFFIHVPVLATGVSFFCDTLGFQQTYLQDNYTYLQRDRVAVRMLGYDGADVPPQKGDRRFCYYIDVTDVDALYTELKPKLDRMPAGDVYGPVTQPYGQRELLVLAPDNNLIVFGQGVFAQADAQVSESV